MAGKLRPQGKSQAEPRRTSATRMALPNGARSTPTSPITDRRIETVLRALPERELFALAERIGLGLDSRKRIDAPAQLARALVRLPELKDTARLGPAPLGLLHRIADAGGLLKVPAVPTGLEQLAYRGIVFARSVGGSIELILPTAFLVQLRPWDAEDPRCLRALLAEASFETASAVAAHYLGRTAAPPIALSLEPAWEALHDPDSLAEIVGGVSYEERRLLEALVRLGGEVDSEELMDLERRPMRLSGAGSLATGRRGAAFFLEKRGLLFPVAPARFVVPREVVVMVDADRLERQAERRAGIRSQVVAQDVLPRRARFSPSPAGFAVAMALAVREARGEVKPGVGTPRSLVARIANRFGKDPEAAALIATLSRVVGLWDASGQGAFAPPWTWSFDDLARGLFDAWRRGVAWDEGRPVPETLRLAPEHRDPSPVRAVRDLVLDGLRELGSTRWIPLQALLAYVRHDPRTDGLERLLSRWAARAGVDSVSVVGLGGRIATESLPALGVLDLGDLDSADSGEADDRGPALRLTARGRDWLEVEQGEVSRGRRTDDQCAVFLDRGLLRCGRDTSVGDVAAAAGFADLGAAEPDLELRFDAATLARGLALGLDAAEIRRRLETLAQVPQDLLGELERLSAVVGRGTLAGCAAFLWVDDPEVREMLRSRPACSELFVDPSPPGGLLVAPGVDFERLIRRCRAAGVDVDADPQLLRARRTTRPGTNPRQSAARQGTNPRQPAARHSTSPRQPASRSGAAARQTPARAVTWRPPTQGSPGEE